MHPRVQNALTNRTNRTRTVPRFLSRFIRDEDGNLIVFGVFVFLITLMVGGIGVDLMHFERERSKLQNTLDRAVLAAADLDQTLTPQEVVADYFAKAGLSEYLSTVTVDQGIGFSSVSAFAQLSMPTQFMHMTGVDTLNTSSSAADGDASIVSTAEERIDGVEISLVLDVSGSMNSNNKIDKLIVAARDFIDEMVDNTEDGKLSISIIPYATQVAMPGDFITEFNISNEQTYSHCVNFESADFQETSLSQVHPLERTMHFNVWHYDEGRFDDPPETVRSPVCESLPSREMLILQKDADVLKDFISDLTAAGNTSIDIGMKWGSALIDPSLQPVISNMVADGRVDADFAALPLEYNSSDSLKVIVLMTDGQNTNQYFVEDGFRDGNSNVWWNDVEQVYSVYDPDRDEYFWPHDDDWHDSHFGNNGTEPGTSSVLSFSDLWAFTSVAENMRENYRPWLGSGTAWNAWYHSVFDSVIWSEKDTRTLNICDAAKGNDVIIFTIGFEAPEGGETVLRACASSDSHFHDVDGDEIEDAFNSIASSIRKLRLTQ